MSDELGIVSNYGRLRRLANRYCFGVKVQLERITDCPQLTVSETDGIDPEFTRYSLKNDWEMLVVLLIRLRRCLLMAQRLKSSLSLNPKFIKQFDSALPSLTELRNYEKHLDDYSLDIGRDNKFGWGHLESYQYGVTSFSNGVAKIDAEEVSSAVMIAWEAVLSLEQQAQDLGYLTLEDRYGENGKFRRKCL